MNKRDLNLPLLTTVLGGALLSVQPASAQLSLPGGATFDLFGPPGLSPERNIRLKVNDGPFNTVYGNFKLPAGGQLDWHENLGIAIITVTKGMFNEQESNGCVSLYEPGDVFFETTGAVHKITNPGVETAEALITFISPVGSDLVTFVPPPAETQCDPGSDSHGRDDKASPELDEIKDALAANTDAITAIQSLG